MSDTRSSTQPPPPPPPLSPSHALCSCYEAAPGGLEEVRSRALALMAKFNEESKAVKMDLVLFKGGSGVG